MTKRVSCMDLDHCRPRKMAKIVDHSLVGALTFLIKTRKSEGGNRHRERYTYIPPGGVPAWYGDLLLRAHALGGTAHRDMVQWNGADWTKTTEVDNAPYTIHDILTYEALLDFFDDAGTKDRPVLPLDIDVAEISLTCYM
jgi:hypothetical protein